MKRTLFALAAALFALMPGSDAGAQTNLSQPYGKVKPQKDKIVAPPKTVDTTVVSSYRYLGPFAVTAPYMTDSKDAAGAEYEPQKAALLSGPGPEAVFGDGASKTDTPAVNSPQAQIHLAGFEIETEGYAKATLIYEGPSVNKIYLDGAQVQAGDISIEPGTHRLAVKYLTDTSACKPLRIALASSSRLGLGSGLERRFSLDVNTRGLSLSRASLSPGGKYYALSYSFIKDDGKVERYCEIYETASGKLISRRDQGVEWMPSSDRYYYQESAASGMQLVCVDPSTQEKTILAENLPEGELSISPSEDYAVITMETEGPKEGEVHQILVPDDRQPGWRNRSYLQKLDFKTGSMQRLTFGHRNVWLNDISADGRNLLFATDSYDLSRRPTSMMTLLRMNLATMAVDTLVLNDGFIAGASFSPDGKKVAIVGSPEALGGIGLNLPAGRTPNMYDYQLFVMDIASKAVTPLTKDFAPAVKDVEWAAFDGKIYISAEDKDCVNLYRFDPATAMAERLDNKEEYLYSFSLAKSSPQMIYAGQSLCNGDRAWLMNARKGKQALVADAGAIRLANVTLGQGGEYEFTSSRGDMINGFYVLPPDYDPAAKYPLLVHYYGGCSPSARYGIGSYSPQYYAAQGYIFYVVNPSGAAGFGQEFASRHVNTAGQGVAEDILEAVEHFCNDFPAVDRGHIGCFSASYGGFMTQLLLAKSDIFAAGISHAGISDHTSYWGEGYWGYSYSEVAMAGSYPWSHKDLYVDNSPLYMADKIHTPLLFLHGSADTNVPIGESIQMFTALKLLGADTAFVVVDGENHGIRDYEKRRQWLRTISAWFAKYLKEDSSWWDALYPEKEL